jgi:hypothetical protein
MRRNGCKYIKMSVCKMRQRRISNMPGISGSTKETKKSRVYRDNRQTETRRLHQYSPSQLEIHCSHYSECLFSLAIPRQVSTVMVVHLLAHIGLLVTLMKIIQRILPIWRKNLCDIYVLKQGHYSPHLHGTTLVSITSFFVRMYTLVCQWSRSLTMIVINSTYHSMHPRKIDIGTESHRVTSFWVLVEGPTGVNFWQHTTSGRTRRNEYLREVLMRADGSVSLCYLKQTNTSSRGVSWSRLDAFCLVLPHES